MLEDITGWEMAARLGVACVLGGLIGWDRERNDKSAGIRTMILVCVGSAAFIVLTLHLLAQAPEDVQRSSDVTRTISGITSGIGFLGAGAILHSQRRVHGLTTAATIWAAAALGVACGAGAYVLALVLTGFVLATLILVTYAKGRILPDKNDRDKGQGTAEGAD